MAGQVRTVGVRLDPAVIAAARWKVEDHWHWHKQRAGEHVSSVFVFLRRLPGGKHGGSHKEIFLRELISNASDAIDKARHESLTNRDISDASGEWKIKIIPEAKAGTLTISDNGIGMTREEIVAGDYRMSPKRPKRLTKPQRQSGHKE